MTYKNIASSSTAIETSQVPAVETAQARPPIRSIMREGHISLETISKNVDSISPAKLKKFRAKLLTARIEQLYHDIQINAPWNDGW